MNPKKEHIYQMFTPAGVYLGMLPTPSTPFGYNQNLLTTFAQMVVTVPQSADVAGNVLTPITDESGNTITDESGSPLYTEGTPDLVGSTNSNALIANNNLIKVYEVSSYNPNGIKVFDGYVSKWKTKFGTSDDIDITCISNGQDMSQILVQSGDLAVTSQASDDGSSFTSTSAGFGQWILQSFSVATAYQISAISLELTSTVQSTLQISIKQQLSTTPQPSTDTVVASGSVVVPIQTKTVTKVAMTQPTLLNPAYTYYIQIFWQDSSNLTIFSKAGSPYGGGSVYTLGSSGTTFNTPVAQAGYALYFIVYQYGGNVTGVFTNEDPSLILTQVMANYTSQGGLLTPPVSSFTPLASQLYGDSSVPGAVWSTAVAQILNSATSLTFDTVQIKLPQGATTTSSPNLYRGDPSLDQVNVTSGNGTYGLNAANTQVTLPAVLSTSVNPNNGLATIVFASPITLTAATQYYLVWFFNFSSYSNPLQGASSLDPTVSTPFGSLYTGLATFNNASFSMSKPAGIQALYMQLALGAGSTPNGGYSSTGNISTYTFKMQTVLQAIQAIATLAPANWYWYADPATGELKFAQASTTADITLIKGRHINDIDIEATQENVKNNAYFTGGDDGTATSTNILVRATSSNGTRKGLALLSDNRVNSTNGGVVSARQIANNFLNNNAAESYITNVTVQHTTMDINAIKLGMMVGFAGFGNFVERLLLQVVGINRSPDQVTLQLGTLPLRDSQTIAQLQAQLQYQQTVANPTTPS